MWRRTDFLYGLFGCAVAAGFIYLGWSYRMGNLARMGPGFFPFAVAVLLLGVSALQTLKGLSSSEKLEGPANLRTTLLLAAGIVGFALTIESLGLLVAGTLLVGIAIAAIGERLSLSMALLATALLVGSSAIAFVSLLGLPIKVFPW